MTPENNTKNNLIKYLLSQRERELAFQFLYSDEMFKEVQTDITHALAPSTKMPLYMLYASLLNSLIAAMSTLNNPPANVDPHNLTIIRYNMKELLRFTLHVKHLITNGSYNSKSAE